jgi:hypothetical protein
MHGTTRRRDHVAPQTGTTAAGVLLQMRRGQCTRVRLCAVVVPDGMRCLAVVSGRSGRRMLDWRFDPASPTCSRGTESHDGASAMLPVGARNKPTVTHHWRHGGHCTGAPELEPVARVVCWNTDGPPGQDSGSRVCVERKVNTAITRMPLLLVLSVLLWLLPLAVPVRVCVHVV